MPVSADLVQIAIVEEVTYGTTPATPVFQVLPIVDESVAANAETTLSNLLSPNRQVLDSILVNLSAEGDINSELVVCPAFKVLLESAIANALAAKGVPEVGVDPANIEEGIIGQSLISFTIERRIPSPDWTEGVPDYEYQRITGCVVNVLSVTSSPSEAITYSCSIVGQTYSTDDVIIAGATYVNPTDITVLRSPDVVDLGIDGELVTADCFGDFAFNINNNIRGIQCIGTLGNRHTVLGRCEVDLSATIYFTDNAYLDMLLAQDDHTLNFRAEATMETPVDGLAIFGAYFPRLKVASNSVVAGGTGTDVVNEMSMNALYDFTDLTTVKVSVGDAILAT